MSSEVDAPRPATPQQQGSMERGGGSGEAGDGGGQERGRRAVGAALQAVIDYVVSCHALCCPANCKISH